jgi:hypothetical protein
MEREALGLIECRGLVAMIEAADAAVKSAVGFPRRCNRYGTSDRKYAT